MALLDRQILLPFSRKPLSLKHALLHTLYWLLIACFFAYEKRYLIYKASLPSFAWCVAGRIGLLVIIAYLNVHYFLPRFLLKKQYLTYLFLVLLSVIGYLLMQALFDYYLYGFIIGPMRNSNILEAISYNFFSTLWYIGFMIAVKLSIDWYELQNKAVPAATAPQEFLFVKSGTQKIRINYADVSHIEGLKDYAIAHVAGQKIIIKGSVKYMTELFPEAVFIRVHKSFIVAKDKIRRIEKNKILIGEYQIPIGRSYKSNVENHLLNTNFIPA